jgi:hypothetical protein
MQSTLDGASVPVRSNKIRVDYRFMLGKETIGVLNPSQLLSFVPKIILWSGYKPVL